MSSRRRPPSVKSGRRFQKRRRPWRFFDGGEKRRRLRGPSLKDEARSI